jgi:hypothetical protein
MILSLSQLPWEPGEPFILERLTIYGLTVLDFYKALTTFFGGASSGQRKSHLLLEDTRDFGQFKWMTR